MLVESDEMLSTVMRRLDRYMCGHAIRASSESELLTLVTRISDAAVADKVRVMRRLSRAESLGEMHARDRDAASAGVAAPLAGLTADSILTRAFESLESDVERQILWHWLSGRTHAQIAEEIKMSAAAVRKRWERMRARIGSRLRR